MTTNAGAPGSKPFTKQMIKEWAEDLNPVAFVARYLGGRMPTLLAIGKAHTETLCD